MPKEHLDFLLEDRLAIFAMHGGIQLPVELGDGMAGYMPDSIFADQPYRVSAKFRCGSDDRLIDISLAKVAKGRDAIQDLIALMRIAQSRYGELYDCTPQGAQSHSPQATASATQQLTGKPGSRLR
ncbi:hypothetical protein [Nonomuraea sp. NPDC049725]|uniref:hypothetical protein n=1 Tax=Nonomuraea sp. NPDC049725 TaxID=3154508 RepID=UPI00341A86C8